MFFKKVYEDFVELSIGRVYFKPIINKYLTKVEVMATVGNELNSALYYLLMEREIVCLSKRKYNNLTLKDSNKLREKTKEILIREGVWEEKVVKVEPKEANIFSNQDVEWFEKSKNTMLNKIGVR